MSVTTTLSSLLSRNTSRPGVIGTARVDRDIDRLLRRVCPGDIAVLDVLDLDRITADALVDAEIAAVANFVVARFGAAVSSLTAKDVAKLRQ